MKGSHCLSLTGHACLDLVLLGFLSMDLFLITTTNSVRLDYGSFVLLSLVSSVVSLSETN